MAATVYINRYTGTGAGTPTRIDDDPNTRFSMSDVEAPGTSDPVPIPAAGTTYSYWVTTRLQTFTAPSGTIDNLKWFTDGANGFGTGVVMTAAKASTGANAGYRQATSGIELNNTNHTGLDVSDATDAFTYTSGSPLSLTGSTTTNESFGDFVVLQLEVASTAAPGTITAETVTWRYDET